MCTPERAIGLEEGEVGHCSDLAISFTDSIAIVNTIANIKFKPISISNPYFHSDSDSISKPNHTSCWLLRSEIE